MIAVQDTILIKRPIATVFAYVSDLRNAPQWQTGLLEVRKTTEGALGVGSQFTFVRKFLGQKLEASNRFTQYEPNRLIRFVTNSGPLHVEASYLFEATSEGSKVTCKLEMKPQGFSKLAEPLIAASVRREMAAEFGYLKDLLEHQVVEVQP